MTAEQREVLQRHIGKLLGLGTRPDISPALLKQVLELVADIEVLLAQDKESLNDPDA